MTGSFAVLHSILFNPFFLLPLLVVSLSSSSSFNRDGRRFPAYLYGEGFNLVMFVSRQGVYDGDERLLVPFIYTT